MTVPYYADDLVTLYAGDCLDVLRELPDASADSVVTDPPAGIAFMGKTWDHDKGGRDEWVGWMSVVMREALRVTRPGGHAFVWALPRTSHWTGTAIEDAGWEIRDKVVHLFGSGFPKSHNLTGEWAGWGTALKPATEDWWLARRPLDGTVAANVLRHGTGALNIDASRIHSGPSVGGATSGDTALGQGSGWNAHANRPTDIDRSMVAGRWPSNVILDESQAAELDRQSGFRQPGARPAAASITSAPGANGTMGSGWAGSGQAEREVVDEGGGASRFFYVPKAPTAERPRIGKGTPAASAANRCAKCGKQDISGNRCQCPEPEWVPRGGGETVAHPTVKPLNLMRYLVRLVTPPGGTVLEPFAGSGTTAEACVIEGFRCIAIEREADYLPLIVQRLTKPIQPDLFGGGAA